MTGKWKTEDSDKFFYEIEGKKIRSPLKDSLGIVKKK